MDNARFSILLAAQNAYTFVAQERAYLFRSGLPAAIVQILSGLFVQFQRPDASALEAYLWGLPATFLFGVLIFKQTRLLLLGEKTGRQLSGPEPRRGLTLCVLSAVLFNMSMVGAVLLLMALSRLNQVTPSLPLFAAVLFLIGLIFWGARFSIAPILGAVSYPVGPVLRKARGALFSIRIVALSLVCVLPPAFLFQALLSVIFSFTTTLTEAQQVLVIASGGILSLTITSLLNAAIADALKQILGNAVRKNAA